MAPLPPEPKGAPAKPGGSPFSKKIGPFPAWVWVVGVGGVGLLFYRRQQAAAAAAAGVGTAGDTLTAGAPMDSSGAPIGSNGTASTGQTMDQWRQAAFAALVHAGVSPALAEQAIDNFINRNPLGPLQSGAINKALGLVGAPPESLPFIGTVPGGGPTPKPPPVPPTHDPGFRLTPIAAPPHINFLPGEHIVDSLRAGGSTSSAGYYLTNLGGIYSVGGARFLGSAFSKPHAAGTQFSQLESDGRGGYTLVATNGHTMHFAGSAAA